uniref:Uncharacterized protein n=1 Tax=Sinocyclocheilus grahami TaxID=75366 RepID=A0A672T0R7_SINGR
MIIWLYRPLVCLLRHGTAALVCRTVTTWSPVGAAFNAKAQRRLDLLQPNLERTCLDLWSQDRALQETEQLVEKACHCPPGVQTAERFDKLSDRHGKHADFIKVAHPDPSYREAIFMVFNLSYRLNTNVELCMSLKDLYKSDLQLRVAELFIFDFEISGIHLDLKKRSTFFILNNFYCFSFLLLFFD